MAHAKCTCTLPYHHEVETYGLPGPVIALLSHMMELDLQLKWSVQLDEKVTRLSLNWQRKSQKNGYKRMCSLCPKKNCEHQQKLSLEEYAEINGSAYVEHEKVRRRNSVRLPPGSVLLPLMRDETSDEDEEKEEFQLTPGMWQKMLGGNPLTTKESTKRSRAPGRMFSLQKSLPKLPVPQLSHTLEVYLSTLQPLVQIEDYQRATKLAEEFSNSEGRNFQQLLEKKALKCTNWLTDWWVDVAYLECRAPNAVYSNPGIMFPAQKFAGKDSQLRYAAKMVSGILDFKGMIDDRTLPVEMLGSAPLCMDQFSRIFSCCRIPGRRKDSYVSFPPDLPDPPRHIVVVHNNHFFSLDVFGANNKPLSTIQICDQLHKIVLASQTPAPPVGILTSDARDPWGKVYANLIKDSRNRETLEAIHRSIFILCLDQPMTFDTTTPTDRQSLIAGQVNHGWGSKRNSGNRWFDKTVQFIVGTDGAVGLNFEHTPAEGTPIISVIDHMFNYVHYEFTQEPAPGVLDPEPLPFNLDPDTEVAMKHAKSRFDSIICDLDLYAYCFDAFGKNFIKAQKLSPDAFIQVCLQLAYYSLHKEHVATYESGSLRRFLEGRTDTIRSCSMASVAYCIGALDAKTPTAQKANLLKDAIWAHRRYTDEVVNGLGIDRHLFGLKMVAQENGYDLPELFTDETYHVSGHWKISTSQVPSKHDAVLCFGPVVEDGYGVCYNPMPDRINLCISAWHRCSSTDSIKLSVAIKKAFMLGYDLLLQTQQVSAGS